MKKCSGLNEGCQERSRPQIIVRKGKEIEWGKGKEVLGALLVFKKGQTKYPSLSQKNEIMRPKY